MSGGSIEGDVVRVMDAVGRAIGRLDPFGAPSSSCRSRSRDQSREILAALGRTGVADPGVSTEPV